MYYVHIIYIFNIHSHFVKSFVSGINVFASDMEKYVIFFRHQDNSKKRFTCVLLTSSLSAAV